MMEALAIGLAVYGAAVTIAWMWAERELRTLGKMLYRFDHDGDGKPGGSKPRGKG